MKFILEPHYDSYGNLYFTALNEKGERVSTDKNMDEVEECINAVLTHSNFIVER